jgi:hypothetical protein
MIFIHSTIEPIFKRSNWTGHGEWHHAILVQGHFMKRCSKDSLPESYIGQVVDLRINLSFNVVQVGTRSFHAIFQRRSLCLSCIFSFHRSFHSFFSRDCKDHIPQKKDNLRQLCFREKKKILLIVGLQLDH